MSNLVFLLAALVLSVAGCTVFLLRHRTPPSSLEHGIDSFSRQMRALAPEGRRPAGGDERAGRPPARAWGGAGRER